MASTATVGTLNVEVALQLAKLQGDFDRMQNMVRNQTKASNRQFKEMGREGAAQLTGLRAEIDKTSKELARKFSGGKLIEGLLGGFGLGTGAAVVETVFRKFESIWKDSAEHAKTLEERADAIAEKMRDLSAMRLANWIDQLAPVDKLAALQKRVGEIRAAISAAESDRAQAVADVGTATRNGVGRMSGVEFSGRYGEFSERASAGSFGDRAQAAADAAQLKATALARDLLDAQKAAAAAAKKIEEERQQRLEKVKDLTERLAKSQAALNELSSDESPAERVELYTAKVEELNRWLEMSAKNLAADPEDEAELKLRLSLIERMTDATRGLAAARKDVASAGEKAADDALRALRDREKMEKDFGEAMSKERQAVIDTKDRRNAGAGLLGQNAREGAAQSIERQQLTVLQRIEQLLSRSPQVATPGAMNLPRGFTF